MTTPTPTQFFSCFHSLPLSFAPPYCRVVYTLKWVVLVNTPFFFLGRIQYVHFTHINTNIYTYQHVNTLKGFIQWKGWEVELTDLYKSPGPKRQGLCLPSPPPNSQTYNAYCKPPLLVEVTTKHEKYLTMNNRNWFRSPVEWEYSFSLFLPYMAFSGIS